MSDMNKILETIRKNYTVEPKYYDQYSVKRGLRNDDGTGVLVGLTNIGSVIGYIIDDGERVPVEGKLSYRGININDLASAFSKEKRHGFEEVSYLILTGELPTPGQLENYCQLLEQHRSLPPNYIENIILRAPSPDIMNKIARGVLALYSFDENPDDISLENVLRQSIEIISRLPMIVAYAYQAKVHYYDKKSLIIHSAMDGVSCAENFLHVIRQDNQYTQTEADILDLSLVLHAEHGGGNNSAFSTRVVTSTGTDTYAAIASGIGSLKGPKHGGANAEVMAMMENIKENVKDWSSESQVADYLAKIIKKEAHDGKGLIYGMGHAIYTLSDPRAILLKEKAELLAKEKGFEEEFNLYSLVEKLTPEVFSRNKGGKVISANVDMYSGFVYKMLNLPEELCTPLFAISRVVGWCAHRIEELLTGGRIIRPGYKSLTSKRDYVPIDER